MRYIMETSSSMLPLGSKAPDFTLYDVCADQKVSLKSLTSPIATVIMFICNHCPYVKHIQNKLIEIAKNYQSKDIAFIAISSNDIMAYPQDGPEEMRTTALSHQFSFPYLYDETQEAAKAYHAACTPDFFVFDRELFCVYRGRFDDSTPGNQKPVTGKDLCTALDNILTGLPIQSEQKASVGCNIKWKK
jgi:peroxiredoxin